VRLVCTRITEREGVVAGAIDDDPSLTALTAATSDESKELDDRQVACDWLKAAKQWRQMIGARHPFRLLLIDGKVKSRVPRMGGLQS